MTQYHDLVLLFIPLTLLGVSGPLALAGVSLSIAVPIGAGLAIAIMTHALFVRARRDHPTPSSTRETPASPPTPTPADD
ncbi:hypothetical protein [Natronorarus salvus]|uniref:hypothetical protein n=1 Tax=Natronorarus salvus TaxID=3117733 RepID=UPI002F26D495